MEQNLAIADISSALQVVEEIKRLQRREAWEIVVDRYSHLTQLLVAVRAMHPKVHPSLSDRAKAGLQSAIKQTKMNEDTIEQQLGIKKHSLDVPHLNKVLSGVLVDLVEIDTEIRART